MKPEKLRVAEYSRFGKGVIVGSMFLATGLFIGTALSRDVRTTTVSTSLRGGSGITFPAASKEVRVAVDKLINITGLDIELKAAGFAVIGVSPRGNPVSEVVIFLADDETKDPTRIVQSHDAARWGPRPCLKITWQEGPALVPQVEERKLRLDATEEEITVTVNRLKTMGAVSVEILK